MNIRYLAVTVLWTLAFATGATLLAGFASGLLFASLANGGVDPTAHGWLIAGVANVWVIASVVGCAIALFLCAFSRLPGTKLPDNQ